MHIAILRVVIAVYIVGVTFLILKAFSAAIFASSARRQAEIAAIPERLGVAFIWPLTLVSRAGRKKIDKHIDK